MNTTENINTMDTDTSSSSPRLFNSMRGNQWLLIGVFVISLVQLIYMIKTDFNMRQNDFLVAKSDYGVVMIITYSFLLFSFISLLLFGLRRIQSTKFPIGTGGALLSMHRRCEPHYNNNNHKEQ